MPQGLLMLPGWKKRSGIAIRVGVFNKKEELANKLGRLEAENELLKELNETQKQQIKSLQDGLLSVQAPESFKYMKDIEYAEQYEEEHASEMTAAKEGKKLFERYVQLQEGSLFESGEDLDSMKMAFTQAVGPPEGPSIHESDES